jgi:CheY-like chemotaxis protein
MTHILIVEDNDRQRNEIAEALAGVGHLVDAASGGNQALSWLRLKRYDLLLTDLMMEEGTGFEVLEWVRVNAPDLPLVICSSYANPENLKAFLNTPLYRIVRKPYLLEDVVAQTTELLHGAK